ncbi:MAG: alpha/beta fold hydrolase [Cytophagales bacterium]|nr:alpha/beta fold hydrolase [Cytophagales bacterium]
MMKYFFLLLTFSICLSGSSQEAKWYCDAHPENVEIKWYETALGPQKALFVYPKKVEEPTELVVFIHGDSPFGDPFYQYFVAKNISKITNAITVALLRPGYGDGCGDVSGGTKGLTYGDNYTEEVVNAIGSVIKEVKKEIKATRTTVMGHSGGAALTALLAASQPQLMEQSILAACPCNLDAWRKSMNELTGDAGWLNPMPGLSPLDAISELDQDRSIHLFVGDKDVVAPSFLTQQYYDELKAIGGNVSIKIFDGEDHESIVRKEVLTSIFTIVK